MNPKQEPELTPDEATALRPMLQALSRRTGEPVSVGSLLRKWNELVGQIQRGYELTVYDYTNDLSVRDFLEEIIEQAPEVVRAKVVGRVSAADAAFREATREVQDAIFGVGRVRRGWWWRRVPARMTEEMLRDLK